MYQNRHKQLIHQTNGYDNFTILFCHNPPTHPLQITVCTASRADWSLKQTVIPWCRDIIDELYWHPVTTQIKASLVEKIAGTIDAAMAICQLKHSAAMTAPASGMCS